MDGTTTLGGFFTVGANVVPITLNLPCGIDWMRVQNYTQTGLPGDSTPNGINFWWQRGIPVGGGIVYYKHNVADNHLAGVDIFTSGGFTLLNDNGVLGQPQGNLGPAVAFSAVSNSFNPVVTTASTAGLSIGSIVRLSNTSRTSITNMDMVVRAITTDTNFTLEGGDNPIFYNAAGGNDNTAGGPGFWRIVNNFPLYYPSTRFVTVLKFLSPGLMDVGTNVPHGYTVGQKVRFNIPAICGNPELNPSAQNNYKTFTIVEIVPFTSFATTIGSCAFRVDISDYNVTPNVFGFPLTSSMPSSFPMVTPVGEDTAASISSVLGQTPQYFPGTQIPNTNTGLLADSTVNTGQTGMILGTGGLVNDLAAVVTGPAGTAAGDFVIWYGGKGTAYNLF